MSDGIPHIHRAEDMPVCVRDGRLVFWSACILAIDLGYTTIQRFEAAGDSWDGATIPRPLWRIIGHPLAPELRWASYWHDRFCESAEYVEDRTHADGLFLALLRRSYVAKWRRLAMWLAVRFYGLTVWRVCRSEFFRSRSV